ncbi:MAG: DNA polymerase III subunit alpha [Candidatus Eisenbacteria bacterium]|uniref:DNA polymerase III subunit alpha n=1 Tax=Eiseniibacteriota bacterium TaxID=2212470 RepID=A0A849SHY0_UNCEI|nr:DNA polymerase III subunit alpha [Candidatus Eisenbacteria bacterium]
MKHVEFVHLHNHSDYSLLDGANPIPRMVARAAELKMPALALTDHGSMFGAIEFYLEARKAGVKPIVGMEAYVTRGRRTDRTRDTAHHLVLLAANETGFRNLIRLSSLAYLEGFYYRPRVDHEILDRYHEGLIALSACPKGEVATDLIEGTTEAAMKTAGMYRDLFGADNYFLEMQNHGLEIEDKIRAGVTDLSRRTGIPLVATNDCHYLRHEDSAAHDVLLCIQTGKTVDDVNRMRYETDQVYFKTASEMMERFADQPEALRNTIAIAERCNLQLEFGKPLLPAFPLPPGAGTPEEYLTKLSREGLEQRFGSAPATEVRERLQYELDVIIRMGFASYMLIVRDFIQFARDHGIAVGPGRGSVAGSLVAYALRITNVDPIQHALFFERFLNPERVTMPDIDIDFDDLRRGEVIAYVKEKYGEESVTQIITFGTMGAKGVVRDVGRALGLAFADVDRVARMVPDGIGMTLERALELSPDLKSLAQKGPPYDKLMKSARTLEGLARHASTHAAGVLITPGPLMDYVPLYRQKDESITTQWDMKAIEKAGLLKMDFLGLRTLSVLVEAVRLVKQHHGVALDLDTLPWDDEPAYRVFQSGDTVAIFQFESGGMRDYLRRLKPTVFGDLTAMNALYRPGPMENIPYFIDCKHGREVAKYEHASLEPILKDTYGVFVYQEQVMAAANVLAGFSLAQGDELRRAMGKKQREEMEAKRAQFVEGCKTNKIPPAKADKIFATMEKFAGYGFNRCATSGTEVFDADSGATTTIGEMFATRGTPRRVLALGDDLRLRPRAVTDVVWNGRRPVFEVVTALGHRITATGNHPLRTLEGWRTIDDLSVGARIAAPRKLPIESTKSWPPHQLIALGHLLAEGNTCHPTTLYFHCNAPAAIDDFAHAIGEFPDTVARIHRRANGRLEVAANLGRHHRAREGDVEYLVDGTGVRVASAWEEFDQIADREPRRSGAFQWAARVGILGLKATQKRVPGAVFALRDQDVALFLGRLWSGDGYLSGKHDAQPFYATSSMGLARDVQRLLLRFGIVSSIRTKSFAYRGTRRPGYTLHLIGDRSRAVFLEAIGPHLVGRDDALAGLRASVTSTSPDRSSKDTVPIEVLETVDAERRARGWTRSRLDREAGVMVERSRLNRLGAGLRRSTVARVAEALGSFDLAKLATSDIFWDRIVSITPKGAEDVYDLTVEHDHNFVADGLIVHNSHSAAYALLAYQSAYLKAHYPAEFMAATMTSEMSDGARIVTLIEECRRMKLEVLPPEVNRSEWAFTLESGRIRIGLGAVRNVGQAAVESLVAARAGGGDFRDLFELARRLEGRVLNRRVLESLVAAGACDTLGPERGRLFAGAAVALESAAGHRRERESGQSSLFGVAGGSSGAVELAAPTLPDAEVWAPRDRSAREKEVLGFYFSEHPLEPLRDDISKIGTHTLAETFELEDGAEVRVVALAGETKTIHTKGGRMMGVVSLEDLTSRMECTVFPDVFESSRLLLAADQIVVVSGRVERRDERPARLMLAEVRALEEARSVYRRSLHLEIRADDISEERLGTIDEILSAHPGDAEVYLHIVQPDHSRLAMRSKRFRVVETEEVAVRLRERHPMIKVRWGRSGR